MDTRLATIDETNAWLNGYPLPDNIRFFETEHGLMAQED